MNKKQYADYQAAVARSLQGLHAVSTGACPGCQECRLPEASSDHDRELAEEPHFSWSSCDVCNSHLGGDRHPAHGLDANGELMHLSVCSDCLYFLNYGQLDDSTMLEIEQSAD